MKRVLLVAVAGLIMVFLPPAEAAPSARPGIGDEVWKAVDGAGRAAVLIALRDPVPVGARAPKRVQAVAQAQADVLARLSPDDFKLAHRYTYVPGLAGTITRHGLEALRGDPQVASIRLDELGSAHLGQSVPALGADFVHSTLELTGKGVTVAMLDTGIDTDHPDLADAIVAQHCFTDGTCPPGDTDEGASAEDEHGHGTNVAGVIAANGVVSAAGFAPDARIVAVRVLGPDASGWISDWIAGLDWIRGQVDAYQIRVVNMSLGTSTLYPGGCDPNYPLVSNAITQLYALGVVTFASTGNQGSYTSVSAPACNTGVVAVGATYDGNLEREPDSGTYNDLYGPAWPACSDASTGLETVACFTNSGPLMDVVAPGSRITSAGMGGGTSTYRGTSQAAPTGAGIAALMLEANSRLSPEEIENGLRMTGTAVTDPKNGLQFRAVNARRAVEAALQPAPTPTPTPKPGQGDLAGRVSLQGRSDYGGVAVSVDGPAATTSGVDGRYRVYNVDPGVHLVQLRHPGYLCAQNSASVAAGQITQLADAALRGGDANGDDRANLFDLVIVGASYGTSPPSDARADINGDNQVNIFDLVLVGGNYGRVCPVPWSGQAAVEVLPEGPGAMPAVVELRALPTGSGAVAVEVWVRGVEGLFAAELRLHFDPAELTVEPGMAGQAGGPWQPGLGAGPHGGYVAANRADPATGDAVLAVTRLAPAGPLSGDVLLGRLVLEAAGSSPAKVRLEHVTLVDREGYALPAAAPGREVVAGGQWLFLPYIARQE